MKRIAVLLLSMILAIVAYGQSNEPNTANSPNKEVYALVTVYAAGSRVEAKIDFGDGTKNMFFANEKGNRRNFASFFEPINNLIKDGWEIEHYTLFIAASCQAIMKKKVNDVSEAKVGMILKED